jgi:hypothetical protein
MSDRKRQRRVTNQHGPRPGLILDDDWSGTGPTEENNFAVVSQWPSLSLRFVVFSLPFPCLKLGRWMQEDMGLSAQDVAEIGGNWSRSLQRLNDDVQKRGKYVIPGYAGDSMSTRSHNHTQCAQRMRQLGCAKAAPETGPMVFTVRFTKTPTAALGLTAIDATLDVAYYLLGRGPVAWIGSGYILGWALSLQYNVPADRPITISDFHVDLFERDCERALSVCLFTAF